MSKNLVVGVSQQTLKDLGTTLKPWLTLAPVDYGTKLSILWRRQSDRTAWVIKASSQMPRLTWIHTDTTGVDRLSLSDMFIQGVTLTNARGTHTPAVSEWALAAILLAAKRFHETVRHSDRHEWTPLSSAGLQLAGRTVLILGVGSIGAALARACSGLGMRAIGVSRTTHDAPYLYRHLTVDDNWIDQLQQVSFLVNCLPLTAATRGLVNESVLAGLPSEAWLVNVGRGETVDEDALLRAMTTGRISGAILDTVAFEPLGRESPLWGHPNLIVGSHRSSFTDQTQARTLELFLAQANRYRRGEPLANVVDLIEGY